MRGTEPKLEEVTASHTIGGWGEGGVKGEGGERFGSGRGGCAHAEMGVPSTLGRYRILQTDSKPPIAEVTRFQQLAATINNVGIQLSINESKTKGLL